MHEVEKGEARMAPLEEKGRGRLSADGAEENKTYKNERRRCP